MKRHCQWPSEIELNYHDTEWGVPVTDDKKWFEYLLLETFQAGLSWKIVLLKREAFRKSFYDFDVHKVAQISDVQIAELRENLNIIKNRLKIKISVTNAQAFIKIQEKFGSFNNYIWQFTDGKTIHNQFKNLSDIPVLIPNLTK